MSDGRSIASSPKPPVLLAEDNADDAMLMRRAWSQAGILYPLVHAWHGEEAISHLQSCSSGQFPALVLLDIKMPRCDGFEVLKWIKSRPDLSSIPAVMLSASSLPADLERARLLHADSYIVKPSAFNQLVELVTNLRQRWLFH